MVGWTSIATRLRDLVALVPFINSALGRLIPSEHPADLGVVKPLDIAPAFTEIITYVLRLILPTGEPSASNAHKKPAKGSFYFSKSYPCRSYSFFRQVVHIEIIVIKSANNPQNYKNSLNSHKRAIKNGPKRFIYKFYLYSLQGFTCVFDVTTLDKL